MAELPGLPVADHPLYKKFYAKQTKSYNKLTGKLVKARIDINFLVDAIEDIKDIERLSFNLAMGGTLTQKSRKKDRYEFVSLEIKKLIGFITDKKINCLAITFLVGALAVIQEELNKLTSKSNEEH